MYTDWFKLRKLPFRLRPDADFLYSDGSTGQALQSLRAAVNNSPGAICLLGEAGTGKTTLLHALAAQYQGAMPVGRIQQPNLTGPELRDALCDQFGLAAPATGESPPGNRLAAFLAEEARHGRAALVLVDEAHRASAQFLRALVALRTPTVAFRLVLAGEPELSKAIEALQTRGIEFGLVDTVHLERLDQTELAAYLDHRLKVAGNNGRALFESEALVEIMRYSGGTPRLVNILCDTAMSYAETHNTQRVGVPEIRDAVQDLKWVEYSARASQAPASTGSSMNQRMLRAAVTQELEVLQSGRALYRMTLKAGKLVIGRGEDVGLRLDSPSVSRRHCQLITTSDETYIEDLGSTNGVLVSGHRRRMHRLVADDKIVIGDHTLIYRESQ